MRKFLGILWCRLNHREDMWPIHGRYVCGTCLREYPIHWDAQAEREETAAGVALR